MIVLMPHQIGKGQVAGSAIGVSFCDLRLHNLQLSDCDNNLRLSDFLLAADYDLSSQSHQDSSFGTGWRPHRAVNVQPLQYHQESGGIGDVFRMTRQCPESTAATLSLP